MEKTWAFFTTFWMGCAILTSLSAQPEDIVSRNYTMQDGLSHDAILSFIQDSQGYLWIGTYGGGLNKFDGYQFTHFLHNPSDTGSLTDNSVSSLWEDRQQRLWVGMQHALNVIDLKTEKFQHLEFDAPYPEKGSTRDVHEPFHFTKIQERKDGKVWICTDKGVYLADPETLSIKRYIHFPQNSAVGDSLHGSFSDIAETPDGSLWMASKEGLIHWDASTGEMTRYHHDPKDPHSLSSDKTMTVYIDRRERLWVGTVNGFDLYNPEDHSFTHFLSGRLTALNAFWNRHPLLENPDGTFWVGFGDGLYAFDPETGKTDQLLDQEITAILKDKQGSIWVTTVVGLYQIAPQNKKFRIERQFGQTKAAFMERVLDLVDTNHFGHDIWDIIPDHDGGWRGAEFQLEKYDRQDQTFSSIPTPFSPTALYKDSRGKIWLGGWGESIKIYDPQTGALEPFSDLTNINVHTFLEDRKGNLWAATSKGLVRYHLQTGQVDVFKHDPANPQSLSNHRIRHLIMDQEGTIWVGTLGGLNKMIPGTENEEPRFVHWRTTNSGLPHDFVIGMVDGGDGTLWLSCGNQISHFFPQTGEFRNYDYRDGLPGVTILEGMRSRTGQIYFKSREGMIVFHPDSLQDNLYQPPVKLTGFSILNEPVPVGGSFGDTLTWETPLTQSISYTNALELTYQQNDLSLEFAALNFVNPENNLYKYKLEPYETEWIETTADNRIARYTNLSPGKYTFRVIGSNNDGLWNEEGKSLSIIIHPPWWQTWWAYTLLALLALLALLSIRHYEMKRLKLRHRAEHLSELDTLKTRFFANISHEFRTPLTLILGPVKQLIDKYHAPDIQNNLSGVHRNAQRLLHLVNQLLDLSKLEAGKLKLEAVKSDIVSFLKARAHAFSSLAESKSILFSIELPEEKTGAYFDRDKLEKIINNLLSNAFKFTREEGLVTLKGQVVTESNKAWFQIQVIDSGKGIPAVEIDKIYDRFYQVDSSHTRDQEGTGIGLALTKELVELHHGTILVESKEGNGTTFTLLLPLGKDHLKVAEIIRELPLPEEETEAEEVRERPSKILISLQDNHPEEETEQATEKPVVLIVEDHQEVRKFIRESIGDQYQIQEAENGKIGVAMTQELLPDLIISDVMMPQMDGYQLCEKIKTDELTSHIPVILLTAKADRQSKLVGLETGADDYLAKPFDAEELQLIIRNRIVERRKMREKFSRDITLEPRSISITSLDEQFLRKVLSIIEDHIDNESFTIEDLSQQVGYSHVHLYRKIKALSGQTPSQFLRTIRLKRAAALLQQKSDSVAQIAYRVGFNNLSYFNKCFKDQFGMTPGQYAAADQPIK